MGRHLDWCSGSSDASPPPAVAADVASLRVAVAEVLGEDGVHFAPPRLAAVVRSVGDEVTGLGPLAPLLADPTVTDVMVNGPADVWVERGGAIERAAVRFASAAAVAALVPWLLAPGGFMSYGETDSRQGRCFSELPGQPKLVRGGPSQTRDSVGANARGGWWCDSSICGQKEVYIS